MFHEFGHALHGMFADQEYPSLSGTNTARDFVEFPSQFNEHWVSDPKVFSHFAKHYQTGEAMPQELVDKIKKADKFNKGYSMTELLSAALLDMHWHMLTADQPQQDVDKFEAESLQKTRSISATCRRVTVPAISSTSGVTATPRATTPICGRKCWRTTPSSGSPNTVA